MHHLFLATRNAHKTREFAEMLGADFALQDLGAHPEIDDVVEDGATFAENAQLKARAVSRQWPGLVLADDSGLEVDSLGGAPGIFSARYAGGNATDAANRRKLLEEMSMLAPNARRTARFRCVLVLARGGEVLATLDGAVEGQILRAERGQNGFGYDSLFQPNGFTKTFAQLSAGEKNALSHRAVAVAKLRDFLETSHLAD
jgi:XTP/dITP diphosphohydrolase